MVADHWYTHLPNLWHSILILRVKGTFMSFKSWFGALVGAGSSSLGFGILILIWYGHWHLIHLYCEFWLSILFLKVQRTCMTFKSWFGAGGSFWYPTCQCRPENGQISYFEGFYGFVLVLSKWPELNSRTFLYVCKSISRLTSLLKLGHYRDISYSRKLYSSIFFERFLGCFFTIFLNNYILCMSIRLLVGLLPYRN